MAKQRSDAARRVRQCERFARLIRITRLLLGHGRWGPESLAREVDCSERTVYRDITTLTMAGIPIHFDKGTQAYQVPAGFRFPGLEPTPSSGTPTTTNNGQLELARSILQEGEQLLGRLRTFCNMLEEQRAG